MLCASLLTKVILLAYSIPFVSFRSNSQSAHGHLKPHPPLKKNANQVGETFIREREYDSSSIHHTRHPTGACHRSMDYGFIPKEAKFLLETTRRKTSKIFGRGMLESQAWVWNVPSNIEAADCCNGARARCGPFIYAHNRITQHSYARRILNILFLAFPRRQIFVWLQVSWKLSCWKHL